MSLSDKVEAQKPTLASRIRQPAPKGWEPGVKFDADNIQFITTTALPMLEGEPDWRGAIAEMGIEIPEGYRVRIAEMKFDPAAWTRDSEDQKLAVTRAIWRYRFIVEPDTSTPIIDGIEILNQLKRTPKKSYKTEGEGTLVLNLNDVQIGKTAGGGTEATLERLDRFFDYATQHAKANRKQIGDAVLIMGGDLVEGCSIYPNQVWEIDRDRRAQIRTMTGITLDLLDRLSPIFSTVRVMAVPGNHGENRLNGRKVNRHDNDDQLVAESAAMATERDPSLSNIVWNIAYDEPALTMDVQGHILASTHGSVYGKMSGSPAQKAYSWYKNMAGAHHPVGDASILVGHHFHHDIITNYGTLLFVQTPAMDGGSPYFFDQSGTDCAPGMATWIMNKQSRFTGYEVLR